MTLSEFDELPEDCLELPAARLHEVFDGPTLIHLRGRREPCLFLSVLTHGNEPVGWEALRAVLTTFQEERRELPRALSILIGNVQAARFNVRHLENQPDFNRVWPGTEHTELAESKVMQQVVNRMLARPLFASIDIHNNTGLNPHYGCINTIAREDLFLAALFSRTMVYFVRPEGVQSLAMSRHCPAVTIECGKAGETSGTEHAAEFISAAMNLSEFPDHPIPEREFEVFHTVATVKVPPERSISFDRDNVDIRFKQDLDRYNFRELPAGTAFGEVSATDVPPLHVTDEAGKSAYDHYFEIKEDRLISRIPIVPSMLTLDEQNIRQDCLCYLMERLRLNTNTIPKRADDMFGRHLKR